MKQRQQGPGLVMKMRVYWVEDNRHGGWKVSREYHYYHYPKVIDVQIPP